MGQIIKLNIRFDREKHYLSVDVALVTSHLLVFIDFPLSTTTGREHKLPTCPKLWLYCGILSLIHIYLCAFAIQLEQHYIKSEVYLTSFQGKYLFYHISFISNSPLFWKRVLFIFSFYYSFSVFRYQSIKFQLLAFLVFSVVITKESFLGQVLKFIYFFHIFSVVTHFLCMVFITICLSSFN